VIRLHLRIYLLSMRWAPVAVVLVTAAVIVASGDPLTGSASANPLLVACGLMVEIGMGRTGGGGLRDLLAARLGSLARLHRAHSTAAAIASAAGAAIVGMLAVLLAPAWEWGSLVPGLGLVASGLLGSGLGSFLRPPLLDHRAISFLGAVGCFVTVVVSGPYGNAVRRAGDGAVGPTILFLVAASLCWLSTVTGSSMLVRWRAAR
jgi:hypothetical protein